MSHPPSTPACRVLRAIAAYKQAHDGNAPAMQELAHALGLVKSSIWRAVQELENAGLLQREPGGGRTLRVGGCAWEWAEPQLYPTGRLGDVLRAVVEHKIAHDGNAPSHREIAAYLGVVYSGAIKAYLDELVKGGYITTEYATDRYICVVGGRWRCDEAWLAAACPPDEKGGAGQLALKIDD